MSATSESFSAGARFAYIASAREVLDRLAVLTSALNVPLEGAMRATSDKAERGRIEAMTNVLRMMRHDLQSLASSLDELGSQPIMPAPIAVAAE